MIFKNAIIFRLHHIEEFAGVEDLEMRLEEKASRDLAPLDPSGIGWIPPCEEDPRLVREYQGRRWITALKQERNLPATVVKREVAKRVKQIEQDQSRRVARHERLSLKEQVYEEMLPKAFIKEQRVDLFWSLEDDLIMVSAGSRKAAEESLDLLRETLGSLKVTPYATHQLPSRSMTTWMRDRSSLPSWLEIGDSAFIKDPSGQGQVAVRGEDLSSDDIVELVESGRHVSQLELLLEDVARITLTDDLALKKIRFDDALIDEIAEQDDGESEASRADAEFLIESGALQKSVRSLTQLLGGEVR